MGFKKKTGKGRLDKYYHLAKDQGYRARSAFKLIQLNKKYDFLSTARCLIDLCAAPGVGKSLFVTRRLQVASKYMPVESLIVGVDLAPIKPIPKCITFQEDITSPKCRAQLREHLKTWQADVVLHDGAPNVGSAWAQDAFSQCELVLESLKLAVEFLKKGGVFVTKVFRSKDYNNLLWVFQQLFRKVEATKPPSSRNVSAEIFVVCKDFLAPKKIDPKFLDIKYVFKDLDADLQEGKAGESLNILKPDKKKQRHRGGYEDGVTILFRARDITELINTTDPITLLGSTNQFRFDSEEAKKIQALEETTKDIQLLMEDLKVLAKKDFQKILKWRRAVYELLNPKPEVPEAVVEVEQESLEDELARLAEEEKAKSKKLRRRKLQKRQKELIRLQLKMTEPMDIGTEQSVGISPFAVANSGDANDIVRGDMENDIYISSSDISEDETGEIDELESDDEDARLEAELNSMYSAYKQLRLSKKEQLKAKYEDWHGIQDQKDSEDSDSDVPQLPSGSSSDDEDAPKPQTLSGKAAMFFDQPLFKDLPSSAPQAPKKRKLDEIDEVVSDQDIEEPVHEEESLDSEPEDDPETAEKKKRSDALKLLTPQALTLAMKLVNREITKTDLISASFHRYAFDDIEELPEWFRDEEKRHCKPFIPVTKEAVQLMRQQQRELDARPIKKIAEAKARKKYKAAQRLAKMQKKTSSIAESSDLTEREKAKTIDKMLSKSKSGKKNKNKVQLVVAKGPNKGTAGRPKGVKGRYKMVDARMKKELRAAKRKSKLSKKRK
ncbi:AdoMet-dependent rRNA methyltransferase spb1 [Massospora cicadina]|nr:AdoMet-dependent rRNA methyltransferase spb1 [Massospora cicadina]